MQHPIGQPGDHIEESVGISCLEIRNVGTIKNGFKRRKKGDVDFWPVT